MTSRQTVRLISDYSVGWPLWNDDGAMDPTTSGVSAALSARLHAWQESFEEAFHYERGWRSNNEATRYAREGRLLLRHLQAEIGAWADVELDLWPVPTGGE